MTCSQAAARPLLWIVDGSLLRQSAVSSQSYAHLYAVQPAGYAINTAEPVHVDATLIRHRCKCAFGTE